MHQNHTSGLVAFTKAEIGTQLARMNLVHVSIDEPDDRYWVVGGSFIEERMRENWLEAERPTEVRLIEQSSPSPGSASTSTGVEPGKVVVTLRPGETARVVAVYHGQDSDGFKVKLADGTEGLILAGDTFKVVTR
ncbi:MAG: hypothetical protein HZB34_14940 [Nitrospirae bacterium]|nr:hypothetical protein [Nitrospirota bacterium]